MATNTFEAEQSYLFEGVNQTGSPERMLLLAVLERAILDYVGNDKREANAAGEWLFSPSNNDADDESDIFTFSWVCRELDLNPSQVAEVIRAMPKRGKRRIAPWYFSDRSEWSN